MVGRGGALAGKSVRYFLHAVQAFYAHKYAVNV